MTIRHFARPLSFSVVSAILIFASGCQQSQNLEGSDEPAADSGAAADSGSSASDSGSTDGGTITDPGKILLFGGSDGTNDLADTWEFDGTSWAQINVTGGPTARASAAGAAVGNSVVMFGGANASGAIAETWKWDGSAWTQITATGPAATASIEAASIGGKMAVFGIGDSLNPQTWIFDGSTWTQNTNALNSPQTSLGFVATNYDNAMLLVESGGLYSFDGDTWTAKPIASGGPSESGYAGAATQDGKVVLFGGEGTDFNSLAETWTYDGTNWTLQSAAGPSGRENPGMATMKDGTVVLFGGCVGGFETTPKCSDGHTWTWNGSSWTDHAIAGPSPRAPGIMVAE